MAQLPHAIRQSIEQFVTVVRKHYNITAVYLYGSYAKRTATPWSDIDLALISPMFADDLFENQVALMRLAARIDDQLEPHPFTEETFTINNPLAYEIQRSGIQLYPRKTFRKHNKFLRANRRRR